MSVCVCVCACRRACVCSPGVTYFFRGALCEFPPEELGQSPDNLNQSINKDSAEKKTRQRSRFTVTVHNIHSKPPTVKGQNYILV